MAFLRSWLSYLGHQSSYYRKLRERLGTAKWDPIRLTRVSFRWWFTYDRGKGLSSEYFWIFWYRKWLSSHTFQDHSACVSPIVRGTKTPFLQLSSYNSSLAFLPFVYHLNHLSMFHDYPWLQSGNPSLWNIWTNCRPPSSSPRPSQSPINSARASGRCSFGCAQQEAIKREGCAWNVGGCLEQSWYHWCTISIYFLELKFKSCMVVWWCCGCNILSWEEKEGFWKFFFCACCCKMWPGTAAWDKRNYWAAVHVNKSSSSPPGCLNSKESTSWRISVQSAAIASVRNKYTSTQVLQSSCISIWSSYFAC